MRERVGVARSLVATRAVAVVLGVILTAGFAGTIAYALKITDPNIGKVVHACYDKGGKKAGKIRLVNEDTECKKTEAALSWTILNQITDFNGTPCTADGTPGTVQISFDANGDSSMTCVVPEFCAGELDGTACDDDDLCTTGDSCSGGACGGEATNCDDGNSCTTDSCDPATGCTGTPVADGTPCGTGQSCQSGSCTLDATCSDGMQNGDEADVDCGGSCGACDTGQGCIVGNDCQSGTCNANICE